MAGRQSFPGLGPDAKLLLRGRHEQMRDIQGIDWTADRGYITTVGRPQQAGWLLITSRSELGRVLCYRERRRDTHRHSSIQRHHLYGVCVRGFVGG